MDKLKLSYKNLTKALKTLDKSIKHFKKFEEKTTWENQMMDYDEMRETLRDSEIQRFEFCVDLFWKYIKKHLEFSLKKPSELNSPREVILSACKSEIISEPDSSKIIDMIKDRNQTSHIYKEEVAEDLITRIPKYYKLMHKYTAIHTP